MKRKLEISELIFKIISYTLLTVFALAVCIPSCTPCPPPSADGTRWNTAK